MLKRVMRHLTMSCLSASAIFLAAASAAETIKVNPIAQYANDSVGNDNIRAECDWNRQIVYYLVRYSRGRVEITDADLATTPGKTLKLVITSAHAIGGGNFSGPKWGYLKVTLSNNGGIVSEFDVAARTQGGKWTACATLTRIAKTLGARTAKQLASAHAYGVENAPKESGNELADEDTDKAE